MSIDWPKLDELKQVLDADPESNAWDGVTDNTRMTRLLAAGVNAVLKSIGDSTATPDADLAQAALRAAQLLAPPVNRAPDDIDKDPIYAALIRGHRRRFAIS